MVHRGVPESDREKGLVSDLDYLNARSAALAGAHTKATAAAHHAAQSAKVIIPREPRPPNPTICSLYLNQETDTINHEHSTLDLEPSHLSPENS